MLVQEVHCEYKQMNEEESVTIHCFGMETQLKKLKLGQFSNKIKISKTLPLKYLLKKVENDTRGRVHHS